MIIYDITSLALWPISYGAREESGMFAIAEQVNQTVHSCAIHTEGETWSAESKVAGDQSIAEGPQCIKFQPKHS